MARPPQVTDEQLRQDIAEGLKPADMVRKYGISHAGVSQRLKKLSFEETLVATVHPPQSVQATQQQLDALQAILETLEPLKKLQKSYDAYLQDPQNADLYAVGPRASDIEVIYYEIGEHGKPLMRKESLQRLLSRVDGSDTKVRAADRPYFDIERAEWKTADPRVEMRATLADIRATIALAIKLKEIINNAAAMKEFREALLSAISKVSPDVARAIAQAVRPVLTVYAASGGPGALPPGAE